MPKISAPTVREHHAIVKKRLIDATEKILREEGPQGLSAGAVASAAGIARNSIYRYVDSVDDLKMLALESFVPRWHQAIFLQVNQEDDPADRLVAFAVASLEYTRDHSHSSLVAMMRMSTGRVGKSAERSHAQGNIDSVHTIVDRFLAQQFDDMGAEHSHLWGSFARSLIFEAFKAGEVQEDFEMVSDQLAIAVRALAERVRRIPYGHVDSSRTNFSHQYSPMKEDGRVDSVDYA